MNEPSILLSKTEIIELTSRQRPKAQKGVLDFMGITNCVRPNGTIVVLRKHLEVSLGCNVSDLAANEPQPNWEEI